MPVTGSKEGVMPAEKFYFSDQVEDDGREPDLVVGWGHNLAGDKRGASIRMGDQDVCIATSDDHSGLDRMIATLKRVRRHVHTDC